MKPYISLGIYRPLRWNAYQVGQDLTSLTHKLGLVPHFDPAHGPLERVAWRSELLHAEVRKRSFKTKMAEGWHYDGDTTPSSKPSCALVLWASNMPTQIRWQAAAYTVVHPTDGEFNAVYQARPYEVVIFHNLHCLHRRPEGVGRIRWVFRQRVALPTTMVLP